MSIRPSTALSADIAVLRPAVRAAEPTTSEVWGELMVAGQNGHAGAYRRLLGELRDWLLGFYGRRLPPAFVDDAVQEALLAVHEKRATYDPGRPFKPWLTAIARYKWIDRLRLMQRSSEALDDDLSVPDHGDAVIAHQTLAKLLAHLSPAQAMVIQLVKIEGLTVEEASRRTGQSPSLVKVNIHRGLAKLEIFVQEVADAD